MNVPVSLAVGSDGRLDHGSFREYRVSHEYLDPDRFQTKNFYDYLVLACDP